MLLRGPRRSAARRCNDAWEAGILLPFLYQTQTIQRRHFRPSKAHHEEQDEADQHSRQYDFAWQVQRKDDVGKEQHSFKRVGSDASPTSSTNRSHSRTTRSSNRNSFRRHYPRREEAIKTHDADRRQHRSVDHVPFERGSAAGAIGSDKSTITPGEKRVFEKLFALKKDQPSNRSPTPKQDDDGDVEDIFENALSKIQSQQHRPATEFPAALKPMADDALDQRERRRADAKEAKRTASIQHDLDATNAHLDAAETDIDLLRALETHILGRVIVLNLDTRQQSDYELRILQLFKRHREKDRASKQDKSGRWFAENQNDLQVMTANFPDHLLHYMRVSTQKFPGSLLALNLIPSLKRLGPSAFALGATTQLYNAHLRLLYARFPFDLHALVEVLQEMDREVYPFDEDTEAILEGILKDWKKYAQRGEGGPALQVMWRTERMVRALKALIRWRDEMARRREEEALKRAREEEVLKEAGLEEGVEAVG